jgi:hypothetical protein
MTFRTWIEKSVKSWLLTSHWADQVPESFREAVKRVTETLGTYFSRPHRNTETLQHESFPFLLHVQLYLPLNADLYFIPQPQNTTRTSTRTITASALTEISFHIILQSTCIFRWIYIITICHVKMSYFFTKRFQFLVCSYLWILTAVITKTNFKYSLCWHAVTVINYLKPKLVYFIFKN